MKRLLRIFSIFLAIVLASGCTNASNVHQSDARGCAGVIPVCTASMKGIRLYGVACTGAKDAHTDFTWGTPVAVNGANVRELSRHVAPDTSSITYELAIDADISTDVRVPLTATNAIAKTTDTQSSVVHLPGTLDKENFGAGGIVTTLLSDSPQLGSPQARRVAVQPDDGKIVAVGTDQWKFAVTRYLTNGSVDSSFGANGTANTLLPVPEGETPGGAAEDVAIQPDGKILVAGWTYRHFALARYLPEGKLDLSFGNAGVVITPIGSQSRGARVKLQHDGKIVVAGTLYEPGKPGSPYPHDRSGFAVARYLPNGSPDDSFGGPTRNYTMLTTPVGIGTSMIMFGQTSVLGALLVQDDGKIILVGGSSHVAYESVFLIARFNADGTVDESFSDGGAWAMSLASGDNFLYGAALQADGKILAGGFSIRYPVLLRLNGNGTLDNNFPEGGPGYIWMKDHPYFEAIRSIAVQGNGQIVTQSNRNIDDTFTLNTVHLRRFSPTGKLDPTFNFTGETDVAIGKNTMSYGITLQPDGNLVGSGYTELDSGKSAFFLFRLWQ